MVGSTSTTRLEPRTRSAGPESVLVIGGGATGLVTLRHLVEQQAHDSQGSYPLFEPLLVERRDDVGGVWYWSDETYALERSVGADNVQGLSPVYDPRGNPHWPSPAYLNLRGNVLPEFLEFSGKKFDPPAHNETFPSMGETQNYLKSFAEPYRKYVKCGVEVLRVHELPGDKGWQVTLKHWSESVVPDTAAATAVSFTPKVQVKTFDRVVVAAGWYDTPNYPDVPGIQLAKEKGHVHHCKHYRDSTPYRGKTVVVVGNNNSANEVAAHLAPLNSVSHPVYRSAKSAFIDKCPALPDARIKDVGLITNYQLVHGAGGSAGEAGKKDTKLDLTLLDGSVIRDVDYVILGTGYGQKYPWLHVLTDAARKAGSDEVEPLTPDSLKGTRVPFMYNHALFSKSPRLTLAFIGLVLSFMPFSFNDVLSAWVVGVWAGKITSVPSSIEDRLQYERDWLKWMYDKRSKAAEATGKKLDPDDINTYSHYHYLGGDLKDGPPSEFHFAAELMKQINEAEPEKAARWHWKWDADNEEKRISMYRRKKEWLYENADRIRNDPFDLLGTNKERYGYLVDQLVVPGWTGRQLASTATAQPAHKPAPSLISLLPKRMQKPALYACLAATLFAMLQIGILFFIAFVMLTQMNLKLLTEVLGFPRFW